MLLKRSSWWLKHIIFINKMLHCIIYPIFINYKEISILLKKLKRQGYKDIRITYSDLHMNIS